MKSLINSKLSGSYSSFFALLFLLFNISYAHSQDSIAARKLVESSKQVEAYQKAQAGGYSFIYNDTSAGENFFGFLLLLAVIAFCVISYLSYIKDGRRAKRFKEVEPYLKACKLNGVIHEDNFIEWSKIMPGDSIIKNDKIMVKIFNDEAIDIDEKIYTFKQIDLCVRVILKSQASLEKQKNQVGISKRDFNTIAKEEILNMTVEDIIEATGATRRSVLSRLSRQKIQCKDYDGSITADERAKK